MENEKLYSPLNFYLRDFGSVEDGVYDENDYWRDEIPHAEAFEHIAHIKAFLADDRKEFDAGRGLAEYLDEPLNSKVQSLVPAIELHGGNLWMVAELQLKEPSNAAEMAELKDWWEGQLSDGWGEGLEQREIKLKHGDLYIEPWTSGDSFFIATQKEFEQRMGISLPQMETPAQAALHEPDIYDDEPTAALRVQLIGRLDENVNAYFDTLRSAEFDSDITGMTSEIAAVAGAHYYLSEIHNFHTSELEYLLQFQNPLAVVADQFAISGMDDYSDVMWEIFDRQDALQGDYALMPDPAGEEARKRELYHRLDSNLSDYCEGLMATDKREIIGMAEEIAAQFAVRDYLKNGYDFQPGEVDYLLQYKHPLALVANQWPDTTDRQAPMAGVVHDILSDRASHSDYLKVDAHHARPAQVNSSEKPSVMEQIRHARKEAKNTPAHHNDAAGKGREPEL